MSSKLSYNKGFTLAEVMVAGLILVLIVGAFVRLQIANMNALSNVRARNVAYSIAKEKISKIERDFERDPSTIPLFVVDQLLPTASDNGTVSRTIGVSGGAAINQDFNRVATFTPVNEVGTELVNEIDDEKYVAQDSDLIKITVVVSWQNNSRSITQESFARRK